MLLARTRTELAAALANPPKVRGLVMTMGALHAGHAQLVRYCRERCEQLVVSIYVNPLQFGPGEDYEAYPRTEAADLQILESLGVDVVFLPSDAEMYPQTPLVRIDPGPMAKQFEGAARPTHFAGVLQVVHKVFNLVKPQVSVFGQKDAQQLALIQTMVRDLDMGIEILPVPIQRDFDGIALSSRNTYLSPQERETAIALSRSILAARKLAGFTTLQEEKPTQLVPEPPRVNDVLATATAVLSEAGLSPDYLEVVDPLTFIPLTDEPLVSSAIGSAHSSAPTPTPTPGSASAPGCAPTPTPAFASAPSSAPGSAPTPRPALIVLACKVGTTRLLDNSLLLVK